MLWLLNVDMQIQDWEKVSEFGNWLVSNDFPWFIPCDGVEAKFADTEVESGKGKEGSNEQRSLGKSGCFNLRMWNM